MPPSILERPSGLPPVPLSAFQAQTDALVGGFTSQATDWRSLASMAAGGLAYRAGRIGVMGLGSGNLLRAASLGLGLGAEVSAFEITNRALQSVGTPLHQEHSNLWRWSGVGGIRQGLLQSFITFGTLKGAGRLARSENLLVQHLFQDLGMVLGHQTSGALGWATRPAGTLAEQFLQAEVTNLQIGAGMALAHRFSPGMQALERGMDLSVRSFPESSPRTHERTNARSGPILDPAAVGSLSGAEPLYSVAVPGGFEPSVMPMKDALPSEASLPARETAEEVPERRASNGKTNGASRIPRSRALMSEADKLDRIRRAQAGDSKALDELIRADEPYIYKVARRCCVGGLILSDLVQEGRMGYMRGVEKFSLERAERGGTKVLTYVGWWVRQSITRSVADTLRTVRIPVNRQAMMRTVQKQMRLLQAKGEAFGLSDVAQTMEMDESQVAEAVNLGQWNRERSTESPVGEDSVLLDLLPDRRPSPEAEVGDRLYQEGLQTHLRRFGEKLGEGDRKNFEAFLMGQGSLSPPLMRRLQRYLSQNGFGPTPENYSPPMLRQFAGTLKGNDLILFEMYLNGQGTLSASLSRRLKTFVDQSRSGQKAASTASDSVPTSLAQPTGTGRMEIPFSSGRAGSSITGKEFLRPKVAVVGFGAAGMTAAHYLRQPGLLTDPDMVGPQITVFEGQHRPGGKIAPDNMGAQFIDRHHFEPVTSMIERLGLSTFEVPDYDRVDFITQDGRVLPGDDFIRALQILRRAAGRLLTEENWQALDQRSAVGVIDDLHRDRLLSEVQREAMLTRLGFEEGTQNISALSFSINLLKSVSPMPRLETKGGLYSWAEAEMAAVTAAGGNVSLNTRVNRLEVLKRGVQVYFDRNGESGSEFFDFAVLALAPEHLSRVEVVGSALPLEIFTRLKPARITKMNMLITGEFPGQEFATPRYAKWFSREPSPALTLFSGWEGAAPLSLTEMFHAAFDVPSEVALRGFEGRTWDGRVTGSSDIPHAYTTLPAPGQGYDVFQFVRQQFFSPRYDDQPLRLASHVLGLGCYVRDAALAGEGSVLSIFRSMGLAVRTGPERGRDPLREFFSVKSLPDFK